MRDCRVLEGCPTDKEAAVRKSWTVVTVLLLAAAWAIPGVAQEGEMPPEMAEYMKFAAPGEHHGHLKAMEGEWTAKSPVWMAPGAPPMESTGKAVNTLILGGRYLAQEYQGKMMGRAFTGMGAHGYDNAAQRYVHTWIDDMSTMMMTSAGNCSDGGKKFTLSGEYEDPVSSQLRRSRYVITVKSPDEYAFEMYDKGAEGPEHKSMVIVYTRIKK